MKNGKRCAKNGRVLQTRHPTERRIDLRRAVMRRDRRPHRGLDSSPENGEFAVKCPQKKMEKMARLSRGKAGHEQHIRKGMPLDETGRGGWIRHWPAGNRGVTGTWTNVIG